MRPHGGNPPLQRIIGAALETDRAGLSHAVGDGDLAHVHLGHDPFHDINGTGRSGHNAGAQAGQVVFPEIRQVQFGDEHGGHAVQGRALLLADCSKGQGRVETVVGNDHGSAVNGAVEVAHHHAEAMVKRHRDTEPVRFGELHGLTDKIAVIEDIEVGQGRALGRPGGAAGELDVYRIVRLQQGG